MHKNILDYCETIKNKFPESFKSKKVLEVGSLDINWSVRQYFTDCDYTWIDLWEWPWVDRVYDFTVKYQPDDLWNFDTIISTEMLEHCKLYNQALINMIKCLKSWWLLLITAAWEWRPEHWTTRTSPKDAPFTNDWYKNITELDLLQALQPSIYFSEYEISIQWTDIRFYWIKC